MKSFACALFVAAACATIIEDKGDCKKTEGVDLAACNLITLTAVQEANRVGVLTPDKDKKYLNEGKKMLATAMLDDRACR